MAVCPAGHLGSWLLMVDLPLDKVQGFLEKVHPFSKLPAPVLKEVARTLLIDYFPQGEIILRPGASDNAFLYLVFSGVARCFKDNSSEKDTLRYVSETDHFGSQILLTGQCDYTAEVREDMICYLVRPEVFANLQSRFEGFRRYFRTMIEPLSVKISACQQTLKVASPQRWRQKMSASQFETSIDTLVGREAVCCELETTVSEIARLMGLTGVGSVIVTSGQTPVGIVTKNDLTEKILARQRGCDVPASEVMTKSPVGMDYKGSCFEASLLMLENHCHHMLALKDEKLFGVISQHDLILLQGANPIAVVGAIDKQKDVAGLKKCVRDMSIVQQAMLGEGGRIGDIWALMTNFRDTLTKRLLVLGIEELRKKGKEPPVFEFCWLTFGTPGREETLLMENFLEGFMFKNPEGEKEADAKPYVQELADMVKQGLLECGLLHKTNGEILCLPESKWRQRIVDFVDGKIILGSNKLRMLDFRGVLEQWGMVDGFRKFVFQDLVKRESFLDRVKARIDPDAVPVCFYGDLVLTSKGLTETIGLKQDVLVHLTDAVRALSMEHGVMALSTNERIQGLRDRAILASQQAANLEAVHTWIVEMGLYKALEEEHGLDWILDPRRCSSDEKRLLTESFRIIRDFIKTIST
jgi:CBS domain-containing protein